MIRNLLMPFCYTVLLLLGNIFRQGDVTVKMESPETVTAGTVFKVRLVFSKSDIQSFSRFYQDIPDGLQVEPQKSANADFSFQDNRIRLIWLKLPETDTFSVEYTIRPDPRLKGKFTLKGVFSYIDNNERKSCDVEPAEITINPSPDIDPNLIVDINDFRKKGISPVPMPSAGYPAVCLRGISGGKEGYLVTLLVDKEKLSSFAKIEETIPPGYIAVAEEKNGAIFTFRDGMAKFLWMNLPSSQEFTVSYRLSSESGHTAGLKMNGTFSYIEDNKTHSVPVTDAGTIPPDIDKAGVEKFLLAYRQNQLKQPLQEQTQDMAMQKETSTTVTASSVKATAGGKVPVAKSGVKKNTPTRGTILAEGIPTGFNLLPEYGIYYRVQIAAGHRLVNIMRYFRKLDIHEEIRTEMHEGWFKYSVGSFDSYKEARDYRNYICKATGVKDAFVIAYNQGKRITVQESLMISNHK